MRYIKRLVLLISISMLSLSLLSVNGLEINKQNITTVNTNSEIELTVEIQKIRSLEKDDPQVNAKEEIEISNPGNFFFIKESRK